MDFVVFEAPTKNSSLKISSVHLANGTPHAREHLLLVPCFKLKLYSFYN